MCFKSYEKLKERWYCEGGYREFFVIAIPLILSTSSLALQELVDRIFLAWYSPETVAAAMPAGILHFALTGLFFGTASYAGTFVAQYYGARKYDRIGPSVWQGVYFSIIGGIVLLCFIPLAPEIFAFFRHDPIVQKNEIAFFQILCFGTFPMIASSSFAGYFSGRGKTWPVMYVNIFVTLITISLDYCLIFGNYGFPELGIEGAGIATVTSAFCGMICYIIIILSSPLAEKYNTRRGWHLEPELFKRLLRYGLPSGIQFLIEVSAFSLFILLIGKLGMESLAATNIAFNINTIAFFPMIGSGITISIMVGQYIGANKPDLAEKSVYTSYHITFIYMSVFSLLFLIFPNIFVDLFLAKSHSPDEMNRILPITVMLLRFVAFYCFFDSANIIFSSAIRGAGDTIFTMCVAVVSTIALSLATTIALYVMEAGLFSCWAIATAYITIMSFIYYLRFKGGKWKKMKIIENKTV
ncbi:MAG TPA: MATE family efflux transporter [Lentisphaeria bacterium]|nr:MAG: MATE family efflux transporter [Lentisphaerae bacterium GWF2_38_69]HBM15901.1 MATE family efflux transporter [Lentisphaeria bacterium]